MVTAQEAARQYRRLGWPTVPLRPNSKVLAVEGFTGRHEAEMTDQDWAAYADAPNHPPGRGGWNIAIRLPDGVIALDVDAYHGGNETMEALLVELGELPPTPISRGREDGGHYFYRVPPGTRLANSAGKGVDLLQHHHRYSVVWPSVVDDRVFSAPKVDGHRDVVSGARRVYGWTLPDGLDSYALDAVPDLPAPWLEHLSRDASAERTHAPDVVPFLDAVARRDGSAEPCAEMLRALADLAAALDAGNGARYDAMVAATLRVSCLAAEGHPGLSEALESCRELYTDAVAGENRDTGAEYARAAGGAVEIAAARPLVPTDPCLALAGPPAVPGGAEEGLEFLPLAGTTWTDRHVAASALVFASRWTRPTDGRAWLTWEEDQKRWSVSQRALGSEGAAGAVASAVAFIRPGDPESQDPLEGARAALHKRMHGTGSAGVYTQAKRLWSSSAMPVRPLRLEELDADPEHLWAGGQCWDLRASTDRPTLADVDPGTVHVHSAQPLPPDPACPTPLWDAFLAAVWPDPEYRAWALRVLSVSVSGYASRTLPYLYGQEPGTGKTSVLAKLVEVLGTYGTAAHEGMLTNNEISSPILAALHGVRLLHVDETPRQGFKAVERLKMLSGGGLITGAPKYLSPITFQATHTLAISTNPEPEVSDYAVQDRLRPILCDGDPAKVREARRKLEGAPWRAEVPGVLSLFITECARWLEDPDSALSREAEVHLLESMGAEADPVAAWMAERTSPDAWSLAADLWSDFATWCAVNGYESRERGSSRSFGRALVRVLRKAHRGKPEEYYRRRTEHGTSYRVAVLSGRGGGPAQTSGAPMTGPSAPSAPAPVVTKPQADVRTSERQETIPPSQGTVPGVTDITTTDYSLSNKEYIEGSRGGDRASEEGIRVTPDSECKLSAGGSEDASASPDEVESRPPAAEYEPVELPALVQRDGLQTTSLSMADAAAVAALWWGRDVTLDVEHTGYPVGHRDFRLKTAQLGDEHLVLVLDAADQDQVALALDTMNRAATVTAHTSQADLIPLAEAGQVDPAAWWAKVVDTAVLAALENPEDVSKGLGIRPDYSLKGLSAYVIPRRLGVDPVAPGADKARAALFRKGKWLTNVTPTTPLKRSGWAQVPVDHPDMVRYAAADVLDTAALRKALADPAPELLQRERAVQRVVARVSDAGLPLDGPYVAERLGRHEEAQADARERLFGLGLDDPASTAKVAAALQAAGHDLPTTEKGNVSVAAEVLEALPKSDLVSALLEWRDLDKVLGTYLRPYHAQVTYGDGRLRPTVQTLGAATTGRMSCVRPNLQQVPREGGIRGCIVADPGAVLISADFSGVELRVFAALSQDAALAETLRSGLDIHRLVAQTVWGPDATKAHRYSAKRGVFAWLYGGGLGTIADALDGNPETARSVISALTRLAPGGIRWADAIREQVRNRRMPYWRHPSGRLTHLPYRLPHKAVNLCIQSTARELLVDALLRWDAGRWGGGVVLPIHDEILAVVPEAEAAEATAYLVECMTSELMGVPIVVEASEPATRWADSA